MIEKHQRTGRADLLVVVLLLECDCGVHADLCKQEDGVCFCNTRGVVGDRCTQ